jgi:hypothetical protein
MLAHAFLAVQRVLHDTSQTKDVDAPNAHDHQQDDQGKALDPKGRSTTG